MQKESRLKIGIVGIGAIAGIHAQAIEKSGNLELLSVFSCAEKNVRGMVNLRGKFINSYFYIEFDLIGSIT